MNEGSAGLLFPEAGLDEIMIILRIQFRINVRSKNHVADTDGRKPRNCLAGMLRCPEAVIHSRKHMGMHIRLKRKVGKRRSL